MSENDKKVTETEASVNENEAAVSKNEGKSVDPAQLAYLIYAEKHRRKLAAEKRRQEAKEKALAEQLLRTAEEKAESEATPAVMAPVAEPVNEIKAEPIAAPEEVAAPEAAEPEKAEVPEAASVAESPAEPQPENDSEYVSAPAAASAPEDKDEDMVITIGEPEPQSEPVQKKDSDDSMVITIGEPEEEKAPEANFNGYPYPPFNNPQLNNPQFDFRGPMAANIPAAAPLGNQDGRILLNIDDFDKGNDNIVTVNGRIYPVEAFKSLVNERNNLMRVIDEHYKAFAMEMERLRQKHMYLRMDAVARAQAERTEEFKLLEKEEARYKEEVDELMRRRDEAAKAYLDRKGELERIIGEYDARSEELDDAGNVISRIARGAADVTAAFAGGLSAGGISAGGADSAAIANARAAQDKALTDALVEKEKALAVAQLETERRQAAEAKLAERSEQAQPEVKAEAKPEENAPEVQPEGEEAAKKRERHVVVPGAIDKAYDDAELQKRLAEYREERRKRTDVELQNLSAYVAATEKELSALDKEYKKLESTPAANDAERVVGVVDRLGVLRRVVEKMIDKLVACKEAGAPAPVFQRHADELREATAEYNSVVDEYAALTGHKLTRAAYDTADRIQKGEEYQLLPVITARREVVSKDGKPVEKLAESDRRAAELKVDTVVDGKHQLDETEKAAEPTAEVAVPKQTRPERVAFSAVTMTEKDIPKFYKQQKAKEAKLTERESVLASIKPQTTEDKVVLTVERLGTERELIASYSKDLKLAVRTADKKRIRTYKKQLSAHIDNYNRLAGEYSHITGDSLTLADTSIPERIANGERYKALPVISYRKEAADGTLLSDQTGAGTTSGAAYALIPEKQRRALEKRGIIEKTRATSITGLSKREAKERLKAEKAALKEKAQQLDASSKENAKLAKESAKLAKRGPRSERAEHKEKALEYANKSMEEAKLSREAAATEKELKNLKAYEQYLLIKEAEEEARQAHEEADEAVYGERLETKAARAGIKPELKEDAPAKDEIAEFRKLSKKEKREKIKEEREALLAEAKAYEEEAALTALKAKEEKKLSKSGLRKERAAHKAEAERLQKESNVALKRAGEAKETAKSLKTEEDYERYLVKRAERAALKEASRSDEYKSAAPIALKKEPDELERFEKLTSRQKREKLKEEKEALLAEAKSHEEMAKFDAFKAKEEKKLAKRGSRAERAAHKAEAERLTEKSIEESVKAKKTAKTARELSSVEAYEKYLQQKQQRVDTGADAASDKYDRALAKREERKDLARVGSELTAFEALSKKQQKAEVKKTREQLKQNAEQLREEAKASAKSAKEEEKLAKRGSRAERAERKAEARRLAEKSREQERLSKEAEKTAKSLKSVEDYEKYLSDKEEARVKSYEAAPSKVKPSKEEEVDTRAFDTSMSKRELRQEAKRRSIELEREYNRQVAEKKEADRLAEKERKLSRKASRADKPVHESEAEAYEAQSRELQESLDKAKAEKERLKSLKSRRDFDEYNKALERAKSKEDKAISDYERYNAEREQLRANKYLSDSKEPRAEAAEKKPTYDFGDADKLVKRDRAAIEAFCRESGSSDMKMLERRYETRAALAQHELNVKELHFGKKNKKYRKTTDELNKEIENVERHMPRAMKAEMRDNERYFTAVRIDTNKVKLPRKVDRSKLANLQVEIEGLINRRDALNKELTALYNSNTSVEDKRNTTYERLRSSKKDAKSSYNKYRKLANRVEDLHVTVEEKAKIFDAMNRITEIEAELGDIKYRLKREKLRGRAKRAAQSTMNARRKELSALKSRIKRLSKKVFRKDGKERHERRQQLTWTIVLIVVVAVAALGYVFRADIVEFAKGLIAQYGGNI